MRVCGLEVIIALLTAAVFIGGILSMANSAKASDPVDVREYKITHVFSADYCGPCHELKRKMQAAGYVFVEKEVWEQPAMIKAFPTVVYVDSRGRAHYDNGQKFSNWQTAAPDPKQPVEIILWRTK